MPSVRPFASCTLALTSTGSVGWSHCLIAHSLQPPLVPLPFSSTDLSVQLHTSPSAQIRKISGEELEIAIQERDRPLIIDFFATYVPRLRATMGAAVLQGAFSMPYPETTHTRLQPHVQSNAKCVRLLPPLPPPHTHAHTTSVSNHTLRDTMPA